MDHCASVDAQQSEDIASESASTEHLEDNCAEPEIEHVPSRVRVLPSQKRDSAAGRRKLGAEDSKIAPSVTPDEVVTKINLDSSFIEATAEEAKVLPRRKRDGAASRRKLGAGVAEKTPAVADAMVKTSSTDPDVEKVPEEVKIPLPRKRDGAAGRRKIAACDADVSPSKLPSTREDKTNAAKLEYEYKASSSKPAVTELLQNELIGSNKASREQTPEQAPTTPRRGGSVDVADLATSEGAEETAGDINDSTSMTDSKTESELIAPKLENLFDADIECLLEEVSSNLEDYKPLKGVSQSKLCTVDMAEMSYMCEYPVDVNSSEESDPVEVCQQELNEVSLNGSQDCSSWADKVEPLSQLDFIEQSPRKVWNKVDPHGLKCETLINDIGDEIGDDIASSWVERNEPVLTEAIDADDRLPASSTMPSDQDPDTLSILQNSKKNKKKNKRRR